MNVYLKKLLTLVIVFFGALLINGCSDSPTGDPFPVVQIGADNNGYESLAVAEILVQNCATSGCHGSNNFAHGLKMVRYEDLMKGSIGRHLNENGGGHDHGISKVLHGDNYGGAAVIPFNSEKSLLFRLISGFVEDSTKIMPQGAPKLSESQIQIIKTWIDNGAKNNKGEIPFDGLLNNIYVCNQGSDNIRVINLSTMTTIRVIDVDFNKSLIDAPHNLAIYEDKLFVTLIGAGKFLKIDRKTNNIISSVDNLVYPGMIELSSDGRTAYVSKSSTAPGNYDEIYIIDTELMQLKNRISLPVSGIPHGIALSNDDKVLVVANMRKDRLSFIDTETLEPIGNDLLLSALGDGSEEPMHTYITPNGQELLVSCMASGSVKVINMISKTVVQSIPLGHHPMQIAISNDGAKAYCVDMHLNEINVLTRTSAGWGVTSQKITNPAFSMLYGVAITSDNKYLAVSSSNQNNAYKPVYNLPGALRPSNLSIIDLNTLEVKKVLDIDNYSTGVTAF